MPVLARGAKWAGGAVMKKRLVVLALLALLILVVAVVVQKAFSPQPIAVADGDLSTSVLPPDVVDRAITLRFYDRKDEALAFLLEDSPPKDEELQPPPCLTMPESAFQPAAGQSNFTQMQRENVEAGNAARALAREAIERSAAVRADGDDAKAEEYLKRVESMGVELSAGTRNKLLQLIGDSILKVVEEARAR